MRFVLEQKLSVVEDDYQYKDNEIEVAIMSVKELKNGCLELPHKDAFLYTLERNQYCKAEIYGPCVFGTLMIPNKIHITREKLSMAYYMQKDKIIFIDDGDTAKKLIGQMMDFDYGGQASSAALFVGFLDLLIRDDVLTLQRLERELAELEEQLITSVPKYFYENVIHYRKSMLVLHTYYEQLIDMGETLEANNNHMFSGDECNAFAIYTNRAGRLHDHVEMLREYILQIREMYQSQIELMQNKTMNILTVVTAIFLPLTLLVGWYGMNFSNMPELSWKYGYLVIVVISVVILAAEVYFFRKKKLL